jgi:hypothetical protein
MVLCRLPATLDQRGGAGHVRLAEDLVVEYGDKLANDWLLDAMFVIEVS